MKELYNAVSELLPDDWQVAEVQMICNYQDADRSDCELRLTYKDADGVKHDGMIQMRNSTKELQLRNKISDAMFEIQKTNHSHDFTVKIEKVNGKEQSYAKENA